MQALSRRASSRRRARSWTSSTPTSTAVETLARLLEAQGYTVRGGGAVRNTYSLRYLTHLLPLPGPVKRSAAAGLHAARLENLRLSVKLGNQFMIAQRPEAGVA